MDLGDYDRVLYVPNEKLLSVLSSHLKPILYCSRSSA